MSIFQLKFKLYYYFLIFLLFKISFSENIQEIYISLDKPYINDFINITEELHMTLNFKDSDIYSLSNSYFHFSTFPLNYSNPDYQQIIYSNNLTNNEYPSMSNSEQYSFRFSQYVNLFTIFPSSNKEQKSYLTIKCSYYPCSFQFKAVIEKDYANLNYDKDEENSDYGSYVYNSNSLKNNDGISKIKFNITHYKYHKMIVTVINQGKNEGNEIKLFKVRNNTENEIDTDIKYKFDLGVIFNLEKNDTEKIDFYALEIISSENKFISVYINKGSKMKMILIYSLMK